MAEISILDEDANLPVLEPRLELPIEKGCRPDRSLDFASLHGNSRIAVAPIAGNDVPPGVHQRVLSARQVDLVSPRANGAGENLTLFEVVNRSDPSGMPDHVNAHVRGNSADIVELGRI